MTLFSTPARAFGRFFSLAFGLLAFAGVIRAAEDRWVGTWSTAIVSQASGEENTVLKGATLRQVVHLSIGGNRWRLRLSNAFGASPLRLTGVHVAHAAPHGAIQPGTDRAVSFGGRADCDIPAGAVRESDPLDGPLAPLADVAVTMHFAGIPQTLTVHSAARATAFVLPGDALAAATCPDGAATFTRWYFLAGVEVAAAPPAAAVVVLGDSITDGHGVTTDGNDRWTDALARRFQANPPTADLAVLNVGIGANRLLRDGVGPSAIARIDRDVLEQPGARWLVVFEGINDIGTRLDARKRGQPYASADDIIGGLEKIVAKAKAHGLRVIGATITPYDGAGFYWSADGEADRQRVNDWIRHSGRFDAVLDFDAALRDPANPSHLAAAYDGGDHLHPSLAGYQHLADSVDLAIFAP